MMAEVGFDKDVAIVTVGALAEECNAKFGDCIDPAHCIAALKKFFSSGVDLKCRSCGWRVKGTRHCTKQGCKTGDGETCQYFRHVFTVVDDRG